MNFEGVHFVVDACKSMTKDEFIAQMIDVHWLDRSKKERRKMLTDAYNLITQS